MSRKKGIKKLDFDSEPITEQILNLLKIIFQKVMQQILMFKRRS